MQPESIYYSNNEPVSVFSINVVSGDSHCSAVNIFLIDVLRYIELEDLLTDEVLLRCCVSLFFWTWTFADMSVSLALTACSEYNKLQQLNHYIKQALC